MVFKYLLYLSVFIIFGCGPEQELVRIQGVLTPIKVTENYGRGGDGYTIKFQISSNLNISLVAYGFIGGKEHFSFGGQYYNKNVEVVYRVNKGLVDENKNKVLQTYSIDKVFYRGDLIFED